jgi:Family of unknown function (DUF6958)
MRLRHPNPVRSGYIVSKGRYVAVRIAILAALPMRAPGLTFDQLDTAVRCRVDHDLFPHQDAIRWHIKAVQLHLEATGEIRRLASRAQPLRYTKTCPSLVTQQNHRV